ncbi:MAG: cyclic nucleotide-binding domain-containing protein [Verrucomicrobia bacterium]|nr:cyclic nucleotide-binding domain-containing protein [Verrucomicrobiota bacterium]MBI3866932.1 cyclic nucleotide-binding domain-containing protein [Verrucomicrobiota bacterium]
MSAENANTGFRIWAADNVVYGPVELPVLIAWVKEERVLANTWIFSEAQQRWTPAAQATELQLFFGGDGPAPSASTGGGGVAIKPGSLRRIKLLADLTDAQLETFAKTLEQVDIRQWTELVKQGQTGDAMFFILSGELRVRLMIAGKESVLTTLGTGEFFGEMALFDDGPRSADVIANQDSTLLKLTAAALRQLRVASPQVAADFLLAVGRSLSARIRADNKRFRDSVNFARSAGK